MKKRNDCWEWPGFLLANGYGRTNKHELAHRLIWESVNGKILKGAFVCHKCDNRRCINPAHLFLGSAADNMRDMCYKKRDKNGRKTHCLNGHPFDKENTLWRGKRRDCRICQLKRQRDWYAKNKKPSKELFPPFSANDLSLGDTPQE